VNVDAITPAPRVVVKVRYDANATNIVTSVVEALPLD
jgi:hypothetical protein